MADMGASACSVGISRLKGKIGLLGKFETEGKQGKEVADECDLTHSTRHSLPSCEDGRESERTVSWR